METRYTHTDYYLPELYNKLLKGAPINCRYINTNWTLHQKIDYLNFIKRGLPQVPIVLHRREDGQYDLIDGCNRINIVTDFMLGGLENYTNAASKLVLEGVMFHVYIIYGRLSDIDIKYLRKSFNGSFSGFIGASAPPLPEPSSDPEIKIITEKKIIIHQKTKIPKKLIHEALKTGVWNRYIGAEKGSAPCTVCKQTQITQREFDTGHVIAEINGGATHIDNLRPICRKCNLSMGAQNMEVFRNKYFS
jgi:hypothetical protein